MSAAHEWMAGTGTVRSAEHGFALAKARDGLSAAAQGTTVQACLAGISDEGQSPESDWPYGDPAWPHARPASNLPASRRARLGTWRRVGTPWLASIGGALRAGNAVILTLGFVQRGWQRAMADGIVAVPPSPVQAGAHAVLAVGVRQGAVSEVIVKNSWGPRWGDGGYGYISEDYLDRFGISAHVLEAA